MTVQQMINKLQEFPSDLEVSITDGFEGVVYEGPFEIKIFEDYSCETIVVDIGVGGCRI